MIEIDGVQYPSEARASAAPPPRPDQELPAGSSEPPGFSDQVGGNRQVVAGRVIETGEPNLVDGAHPMVGEAGRYLQTSGSSPVLDPMRRTEHGDELNDGLGGGVGGAGRPVSSAMSVPNPGAGQTYDNPNSPPIAEEPPASPDEIEAARAMIAEARRLYGSARVLYFVRYPHDRRIMLKFEEGDNPGEVRSLQRAY
ncbi:MAG TPA: hypothetical protein VNT60_06345 [Deinococcales bacterium]|nr:hypothetical protein [Deinococcales bacterium]